jgi:hypothetical protein
MNGPLRASSLKRFEPLLPPSAAKRTRRPNGLERARD